MDVTINKTDHITELLCRIMEFTERRKEILTRNIFDFRNLGFVPLDLPAAEFAGCMTRALCEHLSHDRLLFCDGPHVRFEADGKFKTDPLPDNSAIDMLRSNPKKYLKMQMSKLYENMMNNRIAAELLEQKRKKTAFLTEADKPPAGTLLES